KALDAADEGLQLLMEDRRLALHDLFDIEQELGAARRGGAVPGVGLLNVAVICRTIVAARMWAFGITSRTPKLKALAATLVDVRRLYQSLETAIDGAGELRDDASPDLKMLRERALSLHDELFNELEKLLVKLDDLGVLSDRFVSLRNDRFVIPVKS